jgi:hypothetical protein
MPESLPSKQKSRELLWGGLAARCSNCAWERPYNRTETSHQFPTEDASEIIRAEFQAHECEQFVRRISKK